MIKNTPRFTEVAIIFNLVSEVPSRIRTMPKVSSRNLNDNTLLINLYTENIDPQLVIESLSKFRIYYYKVSCLYKSVRDVYTGVVGVHCEMGHVETIQLYVEDHPLPNSLEDLKQLIDTIYPPRVSNVY